MTLVKRLQIMIEEALDADLDRLARERHVSKAALIRQFVRERIEPLPPIEEDPLWEMVGMGTWEPAHHDDILYPR